VTLYPPYCFDKGSCHGRFCNTHWSTAGDTLRWSFRCDDCLSCSNTMIVSSQLALPATCLCRCCIYSLLQGFAIARSTARQFTLGTCRVCASCRPASPACPTIPPTLLQICLGPVCVPLHLLLPFLITLAHQRGYLTWFKV
jgi:hypothetical protein